MKHFLKLRPYALIICIFLANLSARGQMQRLKVSDNKRFLIQEDGTPFFWLGDTAWELFHRCNKEEIISYLSTRSRQGFNVIQAVALAELDGLNTPNPYGHTPLLENDPENPNDRFFELIDFTINKAAEYGIYIALLPTWGDKLYQDSWGAGPSVFNIKNAKIYGRWLGERYREVPNIIWVLGGDRNPRENTEDIEVWNSMAEGIIEGVGDPDRALISFHPQPAFPGGSSNWFHHAEWLDFNMHQTGHCPKEFPYLKIWHDYQLSPTKPTLDGEPLYEDHPNCFNARDLGYSIPDDIRRIMYWNVFAGGFGQTYGCHDIWQMYKPDKKPVNGPLRPWPEAMNLPGANQMKHLKNLILSREFFSRIPDKNMILTEQENHISFVIATRDSKGSYAMIYFPTGKPVNLDLRSLKGEALKISWFDPRTGVINQDDPIIKTDSKTFNPPSSGLGNDWVLIIDSIETQK